MLRVPNFIMKVMKSIDKTIGKTTYYKYKINLPKRVIEEGKFLDKELKIEFMEGKIIIQKKGKEIKKILTNKEKNIQKELIRLIKK